MGTWAVPNTTEKMVRLEALMAEPLRASDAGDSIYDLVGNDTLFDNFGYAGDNDPTADVRPLIAAQLEEWARWTDLSAWDLTWEDGVKERMIALALRFADANLPEIRSVLDENHDTMRRHIAACLGKEAEDPAEYDVARIMPGVFAVSGPGDHLHRVDIIWGLVDTPHDEATKAALRTEIFPANVPTP